MSVCVHAFIGKDKNGFVKIYQTLPYDYACWGVGRGISGSYNYEPNGYIQFEMCEDNLKNEAYFNEVMNTAIEYCAFLVKEYNLDIKNVISHHEAHLRGFGSNHGDCDHWLKNFGKDMKWFRSEVEKKLNPATFTSYKVKITADELNVRAGAGTSNKINTTVKKGEVYTIVDEKGTWGKLKSGAGWISLNYTKRV